MHFVVTKSWEISNSLDGNAWINLLSDDIESTSNAKCNHLYFRRNMRRYTVYVVRYRFDGDAKASRKKVLCEESRSLLSGQYPPAILSIHVREQVMPFLVISIRTIET